MHLTLLNNVFRFFSVSLNATCLYLLCYFLLKLKLSSFSLENLKLKIFFLIFIINFFLLSYHTNQNFTSIDNGKMCLHLWGRFILNTKTKILFIYKIQTCRTDFEYALVKNRWKNEEYTFVFKYLCAQKYWVYLAFKKLVLICIGKFSIIKIRVKYLQIL